MTPVEHVQAVNAVLCGVSWRARCEWRDRGGSKATSEEAGARNSPSVRRDHLLCETRLQITRRDKAKRRRPQHRVFSSGAYCLASGRLAKRGRRTGGRKDGRCCMSPPEHSHGHGPPPGTPRYFVTCLTTSLAARPSPLWWYADTGILSGFKSKKITFFYLLWW